MINNTITSWFTLTNLTSTGRSTWMDVIIQTGLPEQTLVALMVLLRRLLALTILLERA